MYVDLSNYSFKRKLEKDMILKQKWKFGFNAIAGLLDHNQCIAIVNNSKPNYDHQKVLIVLANQYVIEVPCVIIDTTIHLITFYVSRNAKKIYKDFISVQ